MSADVLVDIQVHEDDVMRMLNNAELYFSPLGMMGLLTSTVSPYVRQRIRNRFEQMGDDVTGPWLPLAPATQEIRQNSNLPIAGDRPINRRTDAMYDYLTSSPDSVFPLGSSGAQLTYPGNLPSNPWTAEKVKTAQAGKVKPNTPARPVLGLGIQDLVFVISSIGVGLSRAAGLR